MTKIIITEQVSGILPLANGGTSSSTAVGAIDAISTQGTDIASATTTNLSTATGQFVNITGTTTITGFGTAAAGVLRDVVFTGILTLTHNATSLILPTAANIATAAGDTMTVRSLGSGNWRVLSYDRASGTSLSGVGFDNSCLVENLSYSVTASLTAVTFTAADIYDTDNFHDTTTNTSRLTIPTGKGGKYTITGSFRFDAGANPEIKGRIFKNGTTIIGAFGGVGGSGNAAFTVTANDLSVAGDYYEFQVSDSNVGSASIRFSIQRIGA